jgi:hypothetical protein
VPTQVWGSDCQGHDFTENLRNKRDFGNPALLVQVIEHFGIDQYGRYPRFLDGRSRRALGRTAGSNYPADVYDPHCFSEAEKYTQLEAARKAAEDARLATRTGVEFVSAGKIAVNAVPENVKGVVTAAALATAAKRETDPREEGAEMGGKRKSRWDARYG